MRPQARQLDNPVWHALSETHKQFAIEYVGIKFYDPDYCTFGGLIDPSGAGAGIEHYATLTESFYVVGRRPPRIEYLKIEQELICRQLVLEKPIPLEIHEPITLLQPDQEADLFQLVNMVQPGFFRKKTASMGRYNGIYQDGALVAAAGERMQMNGYTEVSAIVTHPNYTRRGYASQLITRVTDRIFADRKIPYLHVTDNNAGAIRLYERLGFRLRGRISFWKLKAVERE